MQWAKRRIGEVRWPDTVAQIALGLIATAVVKVLVQDETVRDYGIVGFWLALILGGMALLAIRMVAPVQAHGEPKTINRDEIEAVVTEIVSKQKQASAPSVDAAKPPPPPEPSAPPPTGETVVGTVTSRIFPVFSDAIDYNAPDRDSQGIYISKVDEVNMFKTLQLGELALIRRLAVAPDLRQPSRRCGAVLHASGITHPESSIAKLEDLGLIVTIDGDIVRLTEPKGNRMVYLSNQALVHDEKLVAAYRLVTPLINKVVRFDGGPIA